MSIKKTEYKLLPKQYEFMFGIPEDAFSRVDERTGLPLVYNDIALYQGGFTCKKANAEWLSPTGWKRIDELTKDDLMAVYHPEDNTIKFEKPLEVFKWKADVWYEFHTRTLHQINCPNHKMYTIKDGKEHIQSMKEFYNEHLEDKNGHRGKFVTTFNTEGISTGLTEDELRLLVAYQADGTPYKSGKEYNARFHFTKKRKVERLIQLLKGYKYRISSSNDKDIFICCKIPEQLIIKEFPKEWYNLNSKELKIIIDEIPYWDGSIGKHNCYYTSIKENADFIQFAGSASGYRSTIYTRVRPSVSGSGKQVTEYRVNFNSNTKPSLYSTRKKTEIDVYKADKNEYKYCPSTSTGLWLCREFNLITITGNSGKTFCGSLRGLYFALKWAGCKGLVSAKSQDLLDNTTKAKYVEHLANIGLKEGVHWWFENRKTLMVFVNGSTIMFKTAADWEQFRSMEFAWIELEEASFLEEKLFDELLGRLRQFGREDWEGFYRSLFMHTNPQGKRGWLNKNFINPKTRIPSYRYVTASTRENIFLGQEYINMMEEKYSQEQLLELVEGLDMDNDNTIAFPNFSTDNIKDNLEVNYNYPLILACDFNYNPMCWYLMQEVEGTWYVLRELIQQNVTTKQMCKLIQPAIDETRMRKIIIMGDSHGRDLKTNGSDYGVMINYFNEKGYDVTLRVQKSNPPVKERLTVLRGYIKNAKGNIRLYIDSSCEKLLYNYDEAKNNLGNAGLHIPTDSEIQSDPKKIFLIHPIDATSYPIFYLNSLQEKVGQEYNSKNM